VRIDLHTHSTASDGTQTPAELVRAAHAAGLDVVALTDHDTSEGWAEAADAADEVGITLVRGLEISTRFAGRGAHLLAYLPDPTYQPLAHALQLILDGRNARVPIALQRLRELGYEIDMDDVRRAAGDTAAYGRPHIADALVAGGPFENRDQVFAALLNPGRPAYVDRYAAPLEEMIRVVGEAGGVTVLAHPWGRHGPTSIGAPELARLRGLGLAGLEVDHQDHDADARARLREIADELDLLVTGSSDHHGTGKTDHELGCNTTSPEAYERLLGLADDAAQRSGRRVPEVVAP
jgi:predicted metal-dependent phosphoesterase TrpH